MTTADMHTNTADEEARRDERQAYLAEIRSAREAYLHPADDVARMRAALWLMVLLTRAPDVEASMRARQQLIVPEWDERGWQRDTANLRAHIGATHVRTEANVRTASTYASSVLLLDRRGDLDNARWRLTSALTAARLISSHDGTLGSAIGAHGQRPAHWWLDVVALLDDECEDARPHAIVQLFDVLAQARPMQDLRADVNTGLAEALGEPDRPAEYIINGDLRQSLQRVAGEVPELAMQIRPHLAAQAADGRLMYTVPLMAQSFGSSNTRTATLHIRRVMFVGVRHDDLDPMESLASAVGDDLAGALIISAAVRRNEDDWPDVRVVYVGAEDVAQLA